MRFSDKGFFLIDALLSVFIVSCICIMCFTIFNIVYRYEAGYSDYQERSNREYEQIFNSLSDCEGCTENEYD